MSSTPQEPKTPKEDFALKMGGFGGGGGDRWPLGEEKGQKKLTRKGETPIFGFPQPEKSICDRTAKEAISGSDTTRSINIVFCACACAHLDSQEK